MRRPLPQTSMLDARADRQDLRDQLFQPQIQHLPDSFPADTVIASQWQGYIDAGYILDQGSDGACTGFGLAASIHYLNWMRGQPVSLRSTRMIYHLAQFYDEWPGEDYSGSSCRGALKGWHKHGVCSAALWPYTVAASGKVRHWQPPLAGWADDALQCTLGIYYRVDKADISSMQAALAQTGVLYVSAHVHAGWDRLEHTARKAQALGGMADIPAIPWHSQINGAHAFAIIGYNRQGFVVQNSWGKNWGQQGLGLLSYDDWLQHGTDAWTFALGVPAPLPSQHRRRPYDPLAVPARRTLPLARHQLSQAAAPDCLSSDQAYALSLILDDNGRLIQRLVEFASAADSLDYVAHRAPLEWHGRQRRKTLKIALCCLGSSGDESAQIQSISALAPGFLSAGIYPVFIAWNNGLGQLQQVLQQQYAGQPPSAALDSSIEAAASQLGLKAAWTQLTHNARLATLNDAPVRGLHGLQRALLALQKALPANALQLHLLADGAGALLAGELLSLLTKCQLRSVQLLQPACSLDFASQHFGKAIQQQRIKSSQLSLYVLSRQHQQQQLLAGVYRGGLLNLIANALEDRYRTPILGLAASLDAQFLPSAKPAAGSQHAAYWNAASKASLERWWKIFWQGQPPSGFAETGRGLNKIQQKQLHLIDGEAGRLFAANADSGNLTRRQTELLQQLLARIEAG